MNKAHKELLKKNYEDACEAYVGEMLAAFEVDRKDCFWVADEVGGVFAVGDMLFLDMQEIVYIVENEIAYDDCVDWQDYNLYCDEFNFHRLNLKSWHMGAPRVPQETFDRLRKMKKDIENLCEETKNKY